MSDGHDKLAEADVREPARLAALKRPTQRIREEQEGELSHRLCGDATPCPKVITSAANLSRIRRI